jgi:hypothetical protein
LTARISYGLAPINQGAAPKASAPRIDMHVFIDESGTFSGFKDGSLGVVGALAVPDTSLPKITAKFARMREKLPQEDGEVKGRLLSESQVASVVALLLRYHVILEVTVIDVGTHTLDGVTTYKNALAQGMQERVPRFAASVQADVQAAVDQIRKTSIPLFLQAMTAWDVLERVITHVPMFFAQRQPRELGTFTWVVDGKEPTKVTDWERWWPQYAAGALAARSINRPGPQLVGADYSYFDRFNIDSGGEEGTDLYALFADIRFSSKVESGLELVDVLVNAIRRAMIGNLGIEGWQTIRRLMIHRRVHYISLVRLEGASKVPTNPPYAHVVRHFTRDGKQMLSPQFSRMSEEQVA